MMLLAGCGTGESGTDAAVGAPSERIEVVSHADSRPVSDPDPGALARVGTVITSLVVNSLAEHSRVETNVPVTFGQAFVQGDVPANYSVIVGLENGDSVPTQVDAKAWYPDGSLKHAVVTTLLPPIKGQERLDLSLVACEGRSKLTPVSLGDLTADFDAVVTLVIGNTMFSATLRQGITQGALLNWLEGPLATETHYQTSFTDRSGKSHPLMKARFQLRRYKSGAVRTDIIVENTDAFPSNAGNVSYTAAISVDGETVMPAQSIEHNHHSRWRKTFWSGANPRLHLSRDVPYLIATGAIPNYDLSIKMKPAIIKRLATRWQNDVGKRSEIPVRDIMGAGLALEYMPATGGRADIGLLPGWIALYLYTMDEGAAMATFGTADSAGHWPIHYRDAATQLPVSLEDYPRLTTHRNTFGRPDNPLPPCKNCSSKLVPDNAHQPSFVFVPYLLTGDYFYLEELHFWANYNVFNTSPSSRDYGKALYKFMQVRGQAWSLRTLAQAVWITPDTHPLKGYFQTQLDNNFSYYMSKYVNNPAANRLGWVRSSWKNPEHKTVLISGWQDDFFTMVINYARHLGFARAKPLLEWKLQYAMNRMTDPVYCWQFATTKRQVMSAPLPGPEFATIAEAYIPTLRFNFPESWEAISQAECGSGAMTAAAGFSAAGEFAGFPSHPVGYPASLRPVVAAALELDQGWAQLAWERLLEAPRQPRWTTYPSFAILPRH